MPCEHISRLTFNRIDGTPLCKHTSKETRILRDSTCELDICFPCLAHANRQRIALSRGEVPFAPRSESADKESRQCPLSETGMQICSSLAFCQRVLQVPIDDLVAANGMTAVSVAHFPFYPGLI